MHTGLPNDSYCNRFLTKTVFYCEKWGMKTGTHEHTLCTLDLQEIRAHEGARIASDLTW